MLLPPASLSLRGGPCAFAVGFCGLGVTLAAAAAAVRWHIAQRWLLDLAADAKVRLSEFVRGVNGWSRHYRPSVWVGHG